MSALPPSLRRWSDDLGSLVPELALSLGPLILRLDALVGPMTLRPDPGGADPEGYSGLSRRGTYERLSLTEWVLADALPDEFLRRAVMGEHLFLEIERRTPASGRRCVVLIDGGPDQLGAPRIGQLALLVVLARRAAEAGATLQWAVVQSGPRDLRDGISAIGLRGLLAARSAGEPTRAQLVERREACGPLAGDDELWWVGGPTLAGIAPLAGAWLCRIGEDAFSDEEALDVELLRPGAAARRVRLPLPPVADRVRLVRDPFAVPPVSRVPIVSEPGKHGRRLEADLRFSAEGERLLVREAGGSCVAFRVHPGRVKRPQRAEANPQAPFCAVGWSDQNVATVSVAADGSLTFDSGSKTIGLPAEIATAAGLVLPLTAGRWGDVIFWNGAWVCRFPSGELWWMPRVGGAAPVREPTEHCIAFLRGHAGIFVVDSNSVHTTTRWRRRATDANPILGTYEPADEAYIGPPRAGGRVVALRIARDRWRTTDPNLVFRVGPQERVHGVTWFEKHPALLIGDSASLVLRPPDGDDIPVSEAPIVAACASPGSAPRIAWLDRDHRIVVFDVNERRPMFEIHSPETP